MTMHTLVIVVAAVVLVAAYVALMALVGSCLNLHGRQPAPRADRTEGK